MGGALPALAAAAAAGGAAAAARRRACARDRGQRERERASRRAPPLGGMDGGVFVRVPRRRSVDGWARAKSRETERERQRRGRTASSSSLPPKTPKTHRATTGSAAAPRCCCAAAHSSCCRPSAATTPRRRDISLSRAFADHTNDERGCEGEREGLFGFLLLDRRRVVDGSLQRRY